MNNALSDNLFGAAQELVDMTTATLALAAEKNGLEQELDDVRQSITEARGQLEEREAEVGELTEHFLQVKHLKSTKKLTKYHFRCIKSRQIWPQTMKSSWLS